MIKYRTIDDITKCCTCEITFEDNRDVFISPRSELTTNSSHNIQNDNNNNNNVSSNDSKNKSGGIAMNRSLLLLLVGQQSCKLSRISITCNYVCKNRI